MSENANKLVHDVPYFGNTSPLAILNNTDSEGRQQGWPTLLKPCDTSRNDDPTIAQYKYLGAYRLKEFLNDLYSKQEALLDEMVPALVPEHLLVDRNKLRYKLADTIIDRTSRFLPDRSSPLFVAPGILTMGVLIQFKSGRKMLERTMLLDEAKEEAEVAVLGLLDVLACSRKEEDFTAEQMASDFVTELQAADQKRVSIVATENIRSLEHMTYAAGALIKAIGTTIEASTEASMFVLYRSRYLELTCDENHERLSVKPYYPTLLYSKGEVSDETLMVPVRPGELFFQSGKFGHAYTQLGEGVTEETQQTLFNPVDSALSSADLGTKVEILQDCIKIKTPVSVEVEHGVKTHTLGRNSLVLAPIVP